MWENKIASNGLLLILYTQDRVEGIFLDVLFTPYNIGSEFSVTVRKNFYQFYP